MGTFRVQLQAVGGHGCQREVKDGGTLAWQCGQHGCPDCAVRRLVAELQGSGCSVEFAELIHWPDTDGAVLDDLLTHKRTGTGFGVAEVPVGILSVAAPEQPRAAYVYNREDVLRLNPIREGGGLPPIREGMTTDEADAEARAVRDVPEPAAQVVESPAAAAEPAAPCADCETPPATAPRRRR